MDRAALKDLVLAAIEARAGEIVSLGEDIFRHPELGYREERTAEVMARWFSGLGLPFRTGLALTGVRAEVRGRQSLAQVAILGELDAVVSFEHPAADSRTGAAHACGHHAQLAALAGVAVGLAEAKAAEYLDGNVIFLAVPAEEFVEIEFRQRLRRQGLIQFLGGKQELIARGELDGIDLAMMVHAEGNSPQRKAWVGGSSNGFIGKSVRYSGVEAHAGGAPHQGVNALNAALLGLLGIHAQRETFQDGDHVRIHPIITRGGDLVNIIPAEVAIETYVRARTLEAIQDASQKADRALRAGAHAVGAEVTIEDLPGYLPLENNPQLGLIFRENMASLIGEANVLKGEHMAGSTDMGDLSHLMPALHPSAGGFSGRAHTRDFRVTDPEMAYVIPAKALAATVVDLLSEGARLAQEIKKGYPPALTREEYLALWTRLLVQRETG
ncbi:MAG: amidohydrolase [Firmicutes bacterium]|nr:amidohydrolase [Bacillota bacterium]